MSREEFDSLLVQVEKFFSFKYPAEMRQEIWESLKHEKTPSPDTQLVIVLLQGINSSADRITREEFAKEILKMETIKQARCPEYLIERFWKHCCNLDSKTFQYVMEGVYKRRSSLERINRHRHS